MSEKKWYAVYTKPNWEKKISELLNKKKLENYCPLNKVVRKWSDRRKIVMEPLFKSYVFVRVAAEDIVNVKSTYGVLNTVNWLNKPAIIRDYEIEVIKRFLGEFENVRLEKIDLNVDDTVRSINGPLIYNEGKIVEIKNAFVKVKLSSLGYNLVVEMNKCNIEKVYPESQVRY